MSKCTEIGSDTMEIKSCNRQEKMLKLKEELLAVEEDRLSGRKGCTLDELDVYLAYVIANKDAVKFSHAE